MLKTLRRHGFITTKITNKTPAGVNDNLVFLGWNEEEHKESAEFNLNKLHKLNQIQFNDPGDLDEENN